MRIATVVVAFAFQEHEHDHYGSLRTTPVTNFLFLTFIMNAEQNKKYCDESTLFAKYTRSKKLAIYDHIIEKFVVFDTLDAYWELFNETPNEYKCFSEVVFRDVPQSPVIELGLSSNTRFPGTKIVEILRTVVEGMLKLFRNNYGIYDNIARVPSSPDELVIMDEIVQKDGVWYYFFHIHTPTFYFPDYSFCAGFRKLLCALLPYDIRVLISNPIDDPYQLVGISGNFLLSLDNHKRISPYGQFLGTNSSVDKNDLFVSRFSVMHVPAAYEQLRLKPSFFVLRGSSPHSVPKECYNSSLGSIPNDSSSVRKNAITGIQRTTSPTANDSYPSCPRDFLLDNVQPASITESTGIDVTDSSDSPVPCINTEHDNESEDSGSVVFDEIIPVDVCSHSTMSPSPQIDSYHASCVVPQSSTVFISESSGRFRPCDDPNLLTVYAAINFMVVLSTIIKNICRCYLWRNSQNTDIDNSLLPVKDIRSLSTDPSFRNNSTTFYSRGTFFGRSLHAGHKTRKHVKISHQTKVIRNKKVGLLAGEHGSVTQSNSRGAFRLGGNISWDNVCGVLPLCANTKTEFVVPVCCWLICYQNRVPINPP
ncbi:19381_t:CDS:2 [Rhizophagus irregularis]|nr:19381_t:CDS:2 [Rhizophagus irregularis]